MKNRDLILLLCVAALAILGVLIVLPTSPIHFKLGNFSFAPEIHEGLDLRGGLEVLLEADVPVSQTVDSTAMKQVATIISNRVNGLGVTEPLIQTQGARRILVELPGIDNPDAAIATFRETGLLEIIDTKLTPLPLGTKVETTYPKLESQGATGGVITPTVTPPTTPAAPQGTVTPSATVTATTAPTTTGTTGATTPTTPTTPVTVYPTVITGNMIKTAAASRDPNTGKMAIQFELTPDGATIFKDFTTAHADNGNQPFYYLSIVLDKEVISTAHIQSAITEGNGEISGDFTLQEAQNLAVQIRYGALPIPLKVDSIQTIGPTLGQDSIARSVRAGVVGLSVILLFMLIYYRLPGFLADLALILYGIINFALYKVGWPVLLVVGLLLVISYLLDRKDTWALILGVVLLAATIALGAVGFMGVTLTLPAITGFILSTGMAVDANILIFERVREELRAGKSLSAALEAGFTRAWTSIRDANISTLITCGILYYFGSTFGAGTVRGFAITLAMGIIINLFTAITVTRTFIRMVYDWRGEKLRDSRLLQPAER